MHTGQDLTGTYRNAMRILVAEDNELNRKVLTAFLDRLGFDPDVVTDGREALERIQAADYDLILMDLRMPRLDGIAATEAIRALKTEVHQPRIIGVSASATDDDKLNHLVIGFDMLLSKPVRLQQLKLAIEDVMASD